MSYQILNNSNHSLLAAALRSDAWVVACLCAGWCSSCRAYASSFADWAEQNPEHHFVWIDIEDQAELVGDLDIDNFPTLLIQRGATVSFFGPMEPDTRLAQRLLEAHAGKNPAELLDEAQRSLETRQWQEYGLHLRLNNAPDAA